MANITWINNIPYVHHKINVSVPFKLTNNVSVPFKLTNNVSVPFKLTNHVSVPFKLTNDVGKIITQQRS